MNRVKKLLNYTNSKHNILAVVFVLVVLLVAQHPNLFSQPINSVLGKLLVLLIVLLLTHYNIVAGLVATISVIGLHIYLHDSGYEGFENNATDLAKPDPTAPVASTAKGEPAKADGTATSLADSGTGAGTGAPAITAVAEKSKDKTTAAPTANMVNKQLAASNAIKSVPSNSLPAAKGKSETVDAHSPPTGTLSASLIKQ
jgi:hypothetical protein